MEILIILVTAILILLAIFHPKGIKASIQKSGQNKKRMQIEDALKHLYDCEYGNNLSSLQSISGNLSVSVDQASEIISLLQKMKLISTETGHIKLTNEGKSYALKIVRMHRLWERYLADETSLAETEWHEEAHLLEHTLSEEEVNKMAARIGNPLFDPHGDPIPSTEGKIYSVEGKLLSKMSEGDFARIIHLEDEPNVIYSQLVALGLHPGMQIRIMESSTERIKIDAEGEECILSPLVAMNVTVQPIDKSEAIIDSFEPLTSLKEGESAIVRGISRACRGQQRRRLLDLGIVPGSLITTLMRSPSGDPTAYIVREATVALRKEHAGLIFIKKIDSERKVV
jgi:DtxR family transcriptional regulator, Mn-dependent transcriptional regulator